MLTLNQSYLYSEKMYSDIIWGVACKLNAIRHSQPVLASQISVSLYEIFKLKDNYNKEYTNEM